jgi:uncharacterized peroxidase-related enzyme
MAYIREITAENADPEAREILEDSARGMEYVPNYAKVFAHRPAVAAAWSGLIGAIRASMDARRYELVTLAAASRLRSSYCMLAHGTVLLRKKLVTGDQLEAIARDYRRADLTPAEVAMMAFAEKTAGAADTVTAEDVEGLRRHGLSDAEIFDVAVAAAARCFFSKTLDAVGAAPDEAFMALDERLRDLLTVGRPVGRPD